MGVGAKRCLLLSFMLPAAWLAARTAGAAEIGSADELASVEVHAFATQGFILTTGNNYLAQDSKRGSFALSNVAINFTKNLTDNLRFGLQLFGQFFGPRGDYTAEMDWFYVDYRFADWFALRAGRTKIPFGLYNDIREIDAARVPILLPQSLYPVETDIFLLSVTGLELYGYVPLKQAGALDYRIYGGTLLAQQVLRDVPATPYQVTNANVPYLVGGRLMWETPLEGLRVGGSIQTQRFDARLVFPAAPTPTGALAPVQSLEAKFPGIQTVGSVEYVGHDLLLAAEYGRWFVHTDTTNPALAPPLSTQSERTYVMANYRAASWLQPGIYYSLLFSDVDHRGGREHVQHDVATTLRFDLNAHWLMKLEGHFLMGTAAFDVFGSTGISVLNNNVPLGSLTRDWAAFLVNTTGYF
jgi:hypothetical protein